MPSQTMKSAQSRTVSYWLLLIAFMVFVMVVLGGLTRLTDSGLSMVDWRPITGWLPPLNHEQWEAVFTLYKQSPQYEKMNAGMTLPEFQGIFWLEFFHRLWGRIIGLAFGLPLIFFLVKGYIPKKKAFPFLMLFILGGAQGVLGWYMVKSGLIDVPEVSQYRLAAHLGFAFLLFAALIWAALGLGRKRESHRGQRSAKAVTAIWMLSFFTILAGALVAGLDAGLTYNTFPLMDGELVPSGMHAHDPWWINHFENITTVQFQHRLLATLTLFGVLWLAWRYRAFKSAKFCAVLIILQVGLGIATLLSVVQIGLASLHQAGGLMVFGALTWLNYEVRNKKWIF